MSKRFDSRIEEKIAELPGMGWFDSRKSGDVVGYLHKVLWVLALSGVARVRFPAWYGGAFYLALYTPLKLHGTWEAWQAWRSGRSQLGPFRDHRRHDSGIHFGFLVDAFLDLFTAATTTWLLA